jgi:hypothetical protein
MIPKSVQRFSEKIMLKQCPDPEAAGLCRLFDCELRNRTALGACRKRMNLERIPMRYDWNAL